MRSFSNIMPKFATKLHLLVDSISERVRVLTFENTQINLVFCSLIRNFAPDDEP